MRGHLGLVAFGAMLCREVVRRHLKHIDAADADAVNFLRRRRARLGRSGFCRRMLRITHEFSFFMLPKVHSSSSAARFPAMEILLQLSHFLSGQRNCRHQHQCEAA